MAFADAFYVANIMIHNLWLMTKWYFPLSITTDSLPLFDVLTKASFTTEKWLMIDVQTVQDSYKKLKYKKLLTYVPNKILHMLWKQRKRKTFLLTLFKLLILIIQYNNGLSAQTKVIQLLKRRSVNLKPKPGLLRHLQSTHLHVL